jgi:NAD(P)-dependent dehydrogenase (short-subunit alcohol dehydrogenase family)
MTRTVLVTGAGSGFGLAASLYLAARGFRVYATVPVLEQRAEVEAAAAKCGVRLNVVRLDVTDEASIASGVQAIVSEAGGIHAVVHSAGLGLRGFFEDLAESEIRRLFAVNFFGVVAVTRAVLPAMRKAKDGRIVIITSAGGRIGSMTLSAYCAAKFALEGFGESLAMEVAPFGIHVSLVAPGIVMTPHFTVHRGRAANAMNPESPYFARFAAHERLVDGILRTGRLTPGDVARVIHRAVTARRPRLRYTAGWRVGVLTALRRHLPDELFRRFYFRQHARLVERQMAAAAGLSQLALPNDSLSYLGLGPLRKERHGND